jgi:hypothetical protein
MPDCILWIEGVDFSETLFDTEKLSVIRGASRAYEEMPPLALGELKKALNGAKLVRIAAGASQAGFLAAVDGATAKNALGPLLDRLKKQGREPKSVEPVVIKREAALEEHAPFAHLRFHHAIVEVKDDPEKAIETARAMIRVRQLQEPGVRERFSADLSPPSDPPENYDGSRAKEKILKGSPCAFDRQRPAEVIVLGPPEPEDEGRQNYSALAVSRSSGARWQFGRALRQRLYVKAEQKIAAGGNGARQQDLVFTDDFQEMVAEPRPKIPKPGELGGMQDLPLSLENKIAVFVADGDKFGELRNTLNNPKEGLGPVAGRVCFTNVLEARMQSLLGRLVADLAYLRDAADEDLSRAASLRLDEAHTRFLWKGRGRKPSDRLLRFETLLFGGDDLTFVVPAWLGWWLAVSFFDATKDWKITREDAEEACRDAGKDYPDNFEGQDLKFSAGLVFASCKAPIRTLKRLALDDLCRKAKDSGGGLEIEVLESIDPPPGGSGDLRDRLLGEGWVIKGNKDKGEKDKSRLVIPRDKVRACFDALSGYWTGKSPFPATQAYRALREARRKGDLASEAARGEAERYLKEHREQQGEKREPLADACLLPNASEAQALRLFFLLQQRDYVAAAKPWIPTLAASAP